MRNFIIISLVAAATVLAACNDTAPTSPPTSPNKFLIPIGPIPYPIPLPSPTDFVSITAGGYHTCAQRRNGNVYCWGADDYGQAIAPARSTCPSGPCVKTPTLATTATQVDAGYQHTCTLSSGNVVCYGSNNYGELGAGYLSTSGWSQVQGGLTFSAISAGTYSTCGIATAGLFCWGNIMGTATTPQLINPHNVWTSISTGYMHFCAVRGATGEVDCYGSNHYGQIDWDPSIAPTTFGIMYGTQLTTPSTSASVGDNYTCASLTSGVTQCFGINDWGELGNGQMGAWQWTAQTVGHGQALTGVTTGTDHACALDPNLHAYCWGNGNHGELGDSISTVTANPVAVVGGHTFRALAAGYLHTCGISTDNHIWCWGDNSFGQMGVGYLTGGWWPWPVQAQDPTN